MIRSFAPITLLVRMEVDMVVEMDDLLRISRPSQGVLKAGRESVPAAFAFDQRVGRATTKGSYCTWLINPRRSSTPTQCCLIWIATRP